ncbi:MAG: hypothetical protein KAS64_00330 [Spirochaetes bacterium]|nr:hypothetical protein [Spirochaetota bacterium]
MKRRIVFIILLILPCLNLFPLNISIGVTTGITPESLSLPLAFGILEDNANLQQYLTNTGDSFTLAETPKNVTFGLTMEINLTRNIFIQGDFIYAKAFGGQSQYLDDSLSMNVISERSFGFMSVPIYIGIRNEFIRLGVGINFTSATYTEKGSVFNSLTGTLDKPSSFDREYTDFTMGYNFLIGTEFALGKKVSLGLDLVYISIPLVVKREGKRYLDSTSTTVEYLEFPLSGWITSVNLKFIL